MDATKNRATEAQAYEAMRLAQINADKATHAGKSLASSAVSCVRDAEKFFNAGMFGFCHEWAWQSLRYSVGIFHPDYTKVAAERGGVR